MMTDELVATTISSLLAERGTQMVGKVLRFPGHWGRTARFLAENYPAFDRIRRALNASSGRAAPAVRAGGDREAQAVLRVLAGRGFVRREGDAFRMARDPVARTFVSGGWLELMTREALLALGADEAVAGQRLSWRVGGYGGRNEIDAIGRFGRRLVFVSCKAVGTRLADGQKSTGRRQREQMMKYLHETDNLVDHFGVPEDRAVLVLTTDLFDEARRNRARYPALFGKAAALDVHILSLEDLRWGPFTAHLRRIVGVAEEG